MSSKILERVRNIESDALNIAAQASSKLNEYEEVARNARELQKAHSGSWFGDHAFTYFGDFQQPPAGASFDVEWGFAGYERGQHRGWRIRTMEEIDQRLYPVGQTFDELRRDAEAAESEIKKVATRLSDLLSSKTFTALGLSSEMILDLKATTRSADDLRDGQVSFPNMTRDSQNFARGGRYPVHLAAEHQLLLITRVEQRGVTLAEACRRILELSELESDSTASRPSDSIFIGHGRSGEWLKLARHLEQTHKLSVLEFNQESPAGVTTKERLEEMSLAAGFAFLVMTGDDLDTAGIAHARENVIHETGLFQGKLGWRQAVILLEAGCSEFSNIHGLNHIKFDKGRLETALAEVDKVLRREKIIS